MKQYLDKDVYVFILGGAEDYYTQNNNKISPLQACNVTSMIMALDIMGYSFPKLYADLSQPEDQLIRFLRENEEVLSFYQKLNPDFYYEWRSNPSKGYPPNEVHEVLSYGTNLFMGKKVTKFNYSFDLNLLSKEIIINKKPIVMSGRFSGLNHIITLVGVEIFKESFENKQNNLSSLVLDDVKNFIFNDPYGETYNYKSKRNGYNIRIPKNKIITDFKDLSNPKYKWCHTFYDKI